MILIQGDPGAGEPLVAVAGQVAIIAGDTIADDGGWTGDGEMIMKTTVLERVCRWAGGSAPKYKETSMKSSRFPLIASVLGAGLLLAATALADVPRLMSFQGRLSDVTEPDADMLFSLYLSATEPLALFSEQHFNVPLNNGIFSVQIGSQTVGGVPDSALDAAELWLGVDLGSGELSPRTQIGMVPFAAKARSAEQLVIPNTFDPAVIVDGAGQVGIGIASPQFDLDVFASTSDRARIGQLELGGWPLNPAQFCYIGNQSLDQTVNGNYALLQADNGTTLLNAAAGQPMFLMIGNAPHTILTPDGNLGIGTIIPSSRLHVVGEVRVDREPGDPRGGQLNVLNSSGAASVSIHGAPLSGIAFGRLSVSNGTGTGAAIRLGFEFPGGFGIHLDDTSGIRRSNLSHGSLSLINADESLGASLSAGRLTLNHADGSSGVRLKADDTGIGGGGRLRVFDTDAVETVDIRGNFNGSGSGAWMTMRTSAGVEGVSIAADNGGTGAGGLVEVKNAAGVATVRLIGDTGTLSGRVVTSVLEITGGSDLSEQFDIRAETGRVEPGMVVSIDAENPGELIVASKRYDRAVAGIVSGAGGVETGMLMGQSGTTADGAHPVALTGRVYCWADASYGRIAPGDLLTTSDTPGYAMKVTDYPKAQGAILGKAMSSLDRGTGLVLVLVSLQ